MQLLLEGIDLEHLGLQGGAELLDARLDLADGSLGEACGKRGYGERVVPRIVARRDCLGRARRCCVCCLARGSGRSGGSILVTGSRLSMAARCVRRALGGVSGVDRAAGSDGRVHLSLLRGSLRADSLISLLPRSPGGGGGFAEGAPGVVELLIDSLRDDDRPGRGLVRRCAIGLRGLAGGLCREVCRLSVGLGALRAVHGAVSVSAGALRCRVGALRVSAGALRCRVGALRGRAGTLRFRAGRLRIVRRRCGALVLLDSTSGLRCRSLLREISVVARAFGPLSRRDCDRCLRLGVVGRHRRIVRVLACRVPRVRSALHGLLRSSCGLYRLVPGDACCLTGRCRAGARCYGLPEVEHGCLGRDRRSASCQEPGDSRSCESNP